MNDYFHSKAKMDYYIDKINNPSFEEMDDEDKSYIIHEVRRLAMLQRRKETPRSSRTPWGNLG
jgi:hypothetical protein